MGRAQQGPRCENDAPHPAAERGARSRCARRSPDVRPMVHTPPVAVKHPHTSACSAAKKTRLMEKGKEHEVAPKHSRRTLDVLIINKSFLPPNNNAI